MKPVIPAVAVLGGLALLLSACGQREEASEAPATATTQEQPGTDSPSDVSPVNAQTWLDDFTIGSELGSDGAVVAGKTGDDFAPGQAVHIAMEVGDAPEGAAVMVKWVGPDESPVGEETKTVSGGQKYLNFSSKDTGAWKKGDYRAEVWVGDEKVNQQMFQIVDSSKAAG
jgi:L,D-peptidoglycan transpeptidase YkuD (ErfK/YbiS/YcfS/YnhG family)